MKFLVETRVTQAKILLSEQAISKTLISADVCYFLGFYFTGDGALRDIDGDYRITGRMDDVINVSGKRLGTAEIEDAMVTGDVCWT